MVSVFYNSNIHITKNALSSPLRIVSVISKSKDTRAGNINSFINILDSKMFLNYLDKVLFGFP